MDASIYSGLFALAGAAVGGASTIAATLIERRWARAKRDIRNLADQVAAFHQLERLYKDEMAALTGNAPKTILEQMRARVAEDPKFVRPTMTSENARKIRAEWVAN
jgi:hypothetical protein